MRTWFSLFLLSVAMSPTALGADRPDDAEIKAIVDASIRAVEEKDVDAYVATVHPDSPALPTLPDELEALKAYDLGFSISSLEFVAVSGEFALYRVVQHTVRRGGPDFIDNEVDAIWAFRKDGSRWKYWTQGILEMRPLARE